MGATRKTPLSGRRSASGVRQRTGEYATVNLAHQLVQSNWFLACGSLLIFLNTVFIGIETEYQMHLLLGGKVDKWSRWFQVGNLLFAIAFALELVHLFEH